MVDEVVFVNKKLTPTLTLCVDHGPRPFPPVGFPYATVLLCHVKFYH
jgi:hypothetical protein